MPQSTDRVQAGSRTYKGQTLQALTMRRHGLFFVANPQGLEHGRRFALHDRTHRPHLDGATVRLQDCVEVMNRVLQMCLGQGIETDFCFDIHHPSCLAYRMPTKPWT